MIDRWLAIHDDSRLVFLSPARRVAVANSILLAEATAGLGGTPILYRAEDSSGIKSLQEMRDELRSSTDAWNTGSEDDIVRLYSEVSGKVWKRL